MLWSLYMYYLSLIELQGIRFQMTTNNTPNISRCMVWIAIHPAFDTPLIPLHLLTAKPTPTVVEFQAITFYTKGNVG